MTSNSQDSEYRSDSSIVDNSGKPFQRRVSLLDRWRRNSPRMKTVVISMFAVVASLATFLANMETIENFFGFGKPSISLPNIVVKLLNSSKVDIVVYARGDFLLWLPGPEARYRTGKYEFLTIQGQSPADGGVTVHPSDTVTVLTRIMNKDLYAKILSQGDCDLALQIHRVGTGSIFTENIPFTDDAIRKYYLEADVGKE